MTALIAGSMMSSIGHTPESPLWWPPNRVAPSNLNMQRIDRVMKRVGTTAGPSDDGIAVQCTGRDDNTAVIAAITAAKGQWVVITNGQTCAAGDISIPHLRIEKGGLLQ